MSELPLEDSYIDVLRKAQRGLGISDALLAARAGITEPELAQFRDGAFEETIARKLAAQLNLNDDALVELGRNSWRPEPVALDGLARFNTPYKDMTVNSYLAFDPVGKTAVAFDTGTSCAELLEFVRQRQLAVELILLTHTHTDHVADLGRLKSATGASAHVGERENFPEARPLEPGRVFRVGRMKIEARQTSGHARGGMTYIVSGLSRRLAMVGDAMFASSLGGGVVSYEEALRTNRREIFSLPDDTVICPGHGPLTTVGEQKKHNPFFPEFQR